MTNPDHPRLGLFLKLMAAFIFIVFVVGALTTWQARRVTRDQFTLYTSFAGQRQARLIAPLLANYYRNNGGWENVETFLSAAALPDGPGMGGQRGHGPRFMPQATGAGPGVRALVAAPDGRILADSTGELTGAQLDAESLAQGVTILMDDQPVGIVLVTNPEQASEQDASFLRQVNQATLFAVVTASGVALALGGLITWGMTRPLRQLTQAAEAIAEGDLSQRVDVQSSDEIGELAAAFNQMSDRLARAEELRRQMTADIAHELRTPLTVIQGNVEALQDGVFPLTAAALDPIRAKTELLARLVEDLRQLALAEAGQLRLDRTPTDLAGQAGRALDAFQAAAEAKTITLSLEAGEDLPPVEADPQRIEQVLVNLLSNALRYTPEGGRIVVRVVEGNGRLTLSVTDSGPGIPPDTLPYVFERFYRADKGRARDADGSGSGLGLAVARSIIEAHGGKIGVDSPPGAGATFWFSLPVGNSGWE